MTEATINEVPQPQNPVEQSVSLAKSGELDKSFTVWFSQPEEDRTQAIVSVFRKTSEVSNYLPHALNRKDEEGKPVLGDKERFVFKYFPILLSKGSPKLFHPTDHPPIENRELSALSNSNDADMDFLELAEEYDIDLHPETTDVKSAGELFKFGYSTKEMEALLQRVLPHWEQTSPRNHLPSVLVHPFRHADLILNKELFPHVKDKPIPVEVFFRTDTALTNFLSQVEFPSASYFEKVIELQETKVEGESEVFRSSEQAPIPVSAYFFTMLRRNKQFLLFEPPEIRRNKFWKTKAEMDPIREKVVEYLLSDPFMHMALPYLESETAFQDLLVRPHAGGILYYDTIESQGDEARKVKKERFGEVLTESLKFLEEKGDVETAQKVREREVDGVKFADFLNPSQSNENS